MDEKFVEHIKEHLKEDQEVICTICGKTANEILSVKEEQSLPEKTKDALEKKNA